MVIIIVRYVAWQSSTNNNDIWLDRVQLAKAHEKVSAQLPYRVIVLSILSFTRYSA